MKKIIKRILAGILCILIILAFVIVGKTRTTHKYTYDESAWNTNYKYVFVHGLQGWGSYDRTNSFVKYWGMFSGDYMKSLNKSGFDCYAASVSPKGSAWDRACELYAQLTGTVTDYGESHSSKYNHERFGTDYSTNPLITDWNRDNKINLLGHSFGGATIRLLSDLMSDGSDAEQAVTAPDQISPLFTGGKGDWIYSITTLSAPHNGTSVYEALLKYGAAKDKEPEDTEDDGIDNAAYDLHIDHALELNASLQTQDNLFYFSYPCDVTNANKDGFYIPDKQLTENMFIERSTMMGKFTGTTEGGFLIDESWFPNDGLVNTISAKVPFNEPSQEYNESSVKTGIWNIMPTVRSDHMSFMGGMFKSIDQSKFYAEHLNMINSL